MQTNGTSLKGREEVQPPVYWCDPLSSSGNTDKVTSTNVRGRPNKTHFCNANTVCVNI